MKDKLRETARFLFNTFSSSENRKLAALQFFANFLFKDYRLCWPQMDWWSDEDFNLYLHKFNEKGGYNSSRRWMLWQLLRLVDSVPGDTVECGVYKGASSWLICKANSVSSREERIHHLFDSFEGLSRPSKIDGNYWTEGDLTISEQTVLENLKDFSMQLVSHKGWIPEKFENVSDKKFCFVHVDVDLFQPTKDSIEFFYSRLSDGGILLCDDYGFSTCPGATLAIDQFLRDKPEKMISLDAGGGFFIKGTIASRSEFGTR